MDISEQLKLSEEAVQMAQTLKPDIRELEAIKKFCNTEVEKRSRNAESAEVLKDLRKTQKSLKESLLKLSSETKEFALSKADAKSYEELAAADGLAQMPPYLRVIQANKDLTITPELIQESLEELTIDDIKEADGDGLLALKNAVLQKLRRAIRTFTETPKLTTSLPRGTDIYDIAEAPKEVSEQMWTLWKTEQSIKKALEMKKQKLAELPKQDDLKQTIESFFVRTGLTAQRIVIEGRQYRLVRRISVRKPKIGIGKIEAMLEIVLKKSVKNVEAFKPNEIIRGLQIELANVAPETKSNVSLCIVKQVQDA